MRRSQNNKERKALLGLLSADDAAKIIGCTSGNVRRMAREGKLAGRQFGRELWVYEKAVKLWSEGTPIAVRPPAKRIRAHKVK